MGGCESTERSRTLGTNSSGRVEDGEDLAQKERNKVSDEAIAVGAVAALAVVGLAAWGIGSLLSGLGSSTTNKKTMKAPGRDYRIFRNDFEDDPAGYFRDLRKY